MKTYPPRCRRFSRGPGFNQAHSPMINTNSSRPLSRLVAAAACAGLLLGAASLRAATTTNIFSFDSGTAGWAMNPWGGQGQNSAWDGTVDHTGNSGGSLHVADDYSLGDQLVNLGWFSGSSWNDPASALQDLTTYTNISFYVKWDAANSSMQVTDFNKQNTGDVGEAPQFWAIGSGNTWITLGSFTIPNSASNGWAKVNVPIDATIAGVSSVYGLGIKKWTGSGNTGTAAFWVDDITLEANPAVIPPPTVGAPQPPIDGLNLVAVTGPYNRENLQSVNMESWVGYGSTPVKYSFTISKGVDGTGGANFQNHIFLVPNPGSETSPDWNEPNCIFLDLESTGTGGAAWTFRYKTNQPSGNSMMYSAAGIGGTLNTTNPVGTWTVTFVNDTNITMTAPDGGSTNFTLTADVTALFADPLYAYFGVQANNSAAIGQVSVLSEIKISGTANPLDDVFTHDTALNTNLWNTLAVDPQGVLLINSSDAYWVNWTLPDSGYTLLTSSTLGTNASWQPVTIAPVQIGSKKYVLLPQAGLLSPKEGFYRLVKRQFSKLLVLLPGETNAPGTATGKIGTPSAQAAGIPFNITVVACDANWNPCSNLDPLKFTSTDTGASLPLDGAVFLNSGSVTNSSGLVIPNVGVASPPVSLDTGTWTITVTDGSDGTKTGTSSSITIP